MRRNSVLKKALLRIFPVSLAVGVIAAATGYWHAQKVAEEGDIRILTIEATRAVSSEILALPQAAREAVLSGALKDMVGGVFASAAVYSSTHKQIAGAVQPGFEEVGTPQRMQFAGPEMGAAAGFHAD